MDDRDGGVSTKALVQAVKRNAERGGRRFLPYAFTEQGVAMLSSVLRSARAIHVNIEIMANRLLTPGAVPGVPSVWRAHLPGGYSICNATKLRVAAP